MALQYSPKIVTDSLVMCLDASQNKSYPTTDLPVKGGLVMWMDAADDTTFSYSSGTTVSQWRDKSGLNNHCVPLTAGPTRSSFLNSRKVLAFTTGQSIGSLSFTMETSANTVFVVSRLTGSTNSRVLTAYYNNWLLGHWGGNYNQYYAEGWIAYGGYAADTTWRMYMGDWGGSSNDVANAYSNGTLITNQTTSQASAGPKGLGINFQGGEPSTCEAAEIIVFNRVLSAVERRLVHTYLGQKWGISNTDRQIFDLSGLDDNGLLGNGTVANMPVYNYYNKGGLRFNSSFSNYVISPNTTISGSQTFCVWAVMTGKQNSPTGVLSQHDYVSTANFGINILTSNQLAPSIGYTNGTREYQDKTTTGVISYNQIFNAVLVYNAGLNKIYWYINGVFDSEYSLSLTPKSTNWPIGLGRWDPSYDNYYFDGTIFSALIYNKALSPIEVAQNYEAQKSKFANTIVQQGLILNLDAGNPYSYAGAGSTWYDVSGNSKDFLIDGSGITYNSGGYFTLADGGITRSATITNSITCTVVVWIRTTDTQSLIFKGNNLDNYYLAAYYVGQGFYNNNCGSPTYWIDTNSVSNPNPTYLDGNWHMWEMKNVNFSSWTSYEFNKYSGFTFGNGAVGQIMIYDRNLSSAESLQIYNATKGRFGL